MPAIITHDNFGQDVYRFMFQFIGESRDEFEAFLLGNQGPDPLFYSFAVPHLHKVNQFGSTMHNEKPTELLVALKQSLSTLDDQELPVGRAYALGFLCHYLLDSNMHPLVYFQQYQLENAGVNGLSSRDEHEIHAVIESEFDEMILFVKRHKTVATFNPSTEILKASNFVLDTISKIYTYVALVTYGTLLPDKTFSLSVKSFRRIQHIFSSPTGLKRYALGTIEELIRPYSFIRAMSPRAIEITESTFGNHEHTEWENPFTGEVSTHDFWDIYNKAQNSASEILEAFDAEGFGQVEAEDITHSLNFSGEPVVACITIENSDTHSPSANA